MLDGLAIELLAHGYRQISYIQLHCWRHGDIRGGLEQEQPSELQGCPFCNSSCVAQVIGRGFTRLEEIRWEIYSHVRDSLASRRKGQDYGLEEAAADTQRFTSPHPTAEGRRLP